MNGHTAVKSIELSIIVGCLTMSQKRIQKVVGLYRSGTLDNQLASEYWGCGTLQKWTLRNKKINLSVSKI